MITRFHRCVAFLAAVISAAGPALADVSALNQQAFQLFGQGRYQEALVIAQNALSEAERTFGPLAVSTATSLNNLATLYKTMSRYGDALPLYQRALAIRENESPRLS